MTPVPKFVFALVLAVGLWAMAFGTQGARARSDIDLWPRWNVHDEGSDLAADHSVWDGFLKAYVRHTPGGATCFNYRGVRAPDQAVVGAYIGYLERFPVSRARRDEQLAFWTNLYNALTVRTVLKHYPVDSIRDIGISPGWFSVGPWGAKLATVEGNELGLDDIENRILRPIWRDPRIHYALNCASVGCPDLAPRAYLADTIDQALDRGARAFVRHPRAAVISGRGVRLSRIYKWYRDDFGADDQAVIAHIRTYATGDRRRALEGVGRISGYDYDWSLNDCRPQP